MNNHALRLPAASIALSARVSFTDDLTEWGGKFDQIADDIRDALGWASEQPSLRAEAAELAMSFVGLVFDRGLLSEAQQRYGQAAELNSDASAAAIALENTAGAAFGRIIGAETVRLLETAGDIAQEAGHTEQAAHYLASAAMVIARHRGVFASPVPAGVVDSLIARVNELAGEAPSVQATTLMVDEARALAAAQALDKAGCRYQWARSQLPTAFSWSNSVPHASQMRV